MHTTIQTEITGVIAFIMLMMGIMFGLSVFTESHQQMAVNSAVEAAIMDSRDDNARKFRGVYAINQNVFEKDINPDGKYNSYIEKWRKRNYKDVHIKTFYLVDNSENGKKFTEQNKRPGSIPIKGIKVMVLGKSPKGDKEKTLDIATYVVSSNVTLAPHNEDVSGDDVSNDQLPAKVIQ